MQTQQSNEKEGLYSLLRSHGFDPVMRDTTGGVVPVADDAEVFQFNFDAEGDTASVTVSIDDDNKLVVYYGDDVKETGSEDSWYSLLKELKRYAQKHQLSFQLKNKDHLRYDMAKRTHMKKVDESRQRRNPDYKEREEPLDDGDYTLPGTWDDDESDPDLKKKDKKDQDKSKVDEGYYPTGRKSSYSDNIPDVKIILQHSRALEEGERRYRAVEKIFVENQQGERFAIPTNKPGLARVFARHIAEGGTPYDEGGKHIGSLCEEYAKMAGFVRATRSKQFNESTQSLVNEGINHYQKLRETLSKMQGHRGYHAYFENWAPTLTEDEDTTDLSEMFASSELDPRIESVMPILRKLNKTISEVDHSAGLAEWADNIIDEAIGVEVDESLASQAHAAEREWRRDLQGNAPAAAKVSPSFSPSKYNVTKRSTGQVVKSGVDMTTAQSIVKKMGGNSLYRIQHIDQQLAEVSTELLGRYKKAAGNQASALNQQTDRDYEAGDPESARRAREKGNKRFSGIVKATNKQFANDAKGVTEATKLSPDQVAAIQKEHDALVREIKQLVKQYPDEETAPAEVNAKYEELDNRRYNLWKQLPKIRDKVAPKSANEKRIKARKYEGDDAYSWAIFVDGRPVATGLGKGEVSYHKRQILKMLDSKNQGVAESGKGPTPAQAKRNDKQWANIDAHWKSTHNGNSPSGDQQEMLARQAWNRKNKKKVMDEGHGEDNFTIGDTVKFTHKEDPDHPFSYKGIIRKFGKGKDEGKVLIRYKSVGAGKHGEPTNTVVHRSQMKQIQHSMTEAAQGHTIEAQGIRGMKRTAWRKTFKNYDHLAKWADENDSIEVHGTRDLEQAKRGNLSPAVSKQKVKEEDTVSSSEGNRAINPQGIPETTQYGLPQHSESFVLRKIKRGEWESTYDVQSGKSLEITDHQHGGKRRTIMVKPDQLATDAMREGRMVKGVGGVPLDRRGNPIPPKEPKVAVPKRPRGDSNGLTRDDYQKVWRKIEDVVGQIFPDGDPIDWLAPWLEKQGIRSYHVGDVLDKASRLNGYKDIYAYYDELKTGDYGYPIAEDLDADQKLTGQLGPQEKVASGGAVGKLVGVSESTGMLAHIVRLSKPQ